MVIQVPSAGCSEALSTVQKMEYQFLATDKLHIHLGEFQPVPASFKMKAFQLEQKQL